MRILVACPKCRHQYEAGTLQPGAKFRCACGQVLKVKSAAGHDAAVVRCSGCGAPREQGASACGHCSSDFTLHERDLHTVCPHCLTRVSDQARFCHCCGKALTATTVAGETSKLACPSCPGKPRLHSRQLGQEDVALLECQLCAGMWIESRVFEQLIRRAEDKQTVEPAMMVASTSAKQGSVDTREKWSYRHCPVCQAMMQRRNYARRSGVIVDVCREHGVWFDADELQTILAWVRAGGVQQARQRAGEQKREQLARERIAAATSTPAVDYDEGWFAWQPRRGGGSMLVDLLIDSIFKL